MAVPRPILIIAVLGAVLLAATFYTVRGAREQSQSDAISKAVQTAQPQPVKPTPGVRAPAGPKQKAPAKPAKPRPARPAARKGAGARVGLPRRVARAIGQHKIVVVVFYRRGLADDDAVARAAASVRSRRASVFTASPKQLASYKQLVAGLDLSSLPATVIVGRDRKARVVEGFVDGRTLAQEVADSAR